MVSPLRLWLGIATPAKWPNTDLKCQQRNQQPSWFFGKRLGPELGYRFMDIVDYMLLPFIFLFRMAYDLKTSILPFLVHSFHHNMFVVIGWEDYVIRQFLMMMILLAYHIMNNILKFFQSIYLTLSFWPCFLWHLLGPSSKGQSILNTLQHPYTSKIITKRWSLVNTRLQKVDLSSLRSSTFIGHTSAWWQQTSSSTN